MFRRGLILLFLSILLHQGLFGDARSLYDQGRKAQLRENLPLAVELYRSALRINPNYLAPLVGLAESFFSLEEYEESLAHLKRAQKLDQNSLDLLNLEGRIHIALNDPARAREIFENVLKKEPNNLEARFGLAELDIALGRKRNAAQRYMESLRIAPTNPRALLSLALLSEAGGDQAAAAAYLELALKYHSNDPRVQYIAGRVSLNSRNLQDAEHHLRTALALKQDFTEAKHLLAHVYLVQERSDSAIRLMKEMIDEARNDPLAWYSIGLAYAKTGETTQAINSLTQALRVKPGDEIVRIALENIALEKLPINDPTRVRYAEYHLKKGRLFEERNFLDKAAVEYRRCLRLDPEFKAGRLAYAGIFKILGYPIKYQRELEVLEHLGKADPQIIDDIEMISSENFDSVSVEWGIDQYALEKDKYTLSVHHQGSESIELHADAGQILTVYFQDMLQRYENIRLVTGKDQVDSYEEAFRQARTNASDYFLMMRFEESERSFALMLDLYLSATGKKLTSYRVFRTGNERIRDSFMVISSRLQAALPLKGKLIDREFDRAVIDLGALNGLQVDDQLIIVKKGRVKLNNDVVALSFEEGDILGDISITRLDENIAEGYISKRHFFDLINPGDLIVRSLPEEPQVLDQEAESNRGLLRRLFSLMGL